MLRFFFVAAFALTQTALSEDALKFKDDYVKLTGTLGQPFQVNLNTLVTGPDLSNLQWAIQGGAPWMQLDGSTNTLAGIPRPSNADKLDSDGAPEHYTFIQNFELCFQQAAHVKCAEGEFDLHSPVSFSFSIGELDYGACAGRPFLLGEFQQSRQTQTGIPLYVYLFQFDPAFIHLGPTFNFVGISFIGLPTWLHVSDDGAHVMGTPPQEGDVKFQLKATEYTDDGQTFQPRNSITEDVLLSVISCI